MNWSSSVRIASLILLSVAAVGMNDRGSKLVAILVGILIGYSITVRSGIGLTTAHGAVLIALGVLACLAWRYLVATASQIVKFLYSTGNPGLKRELKDFPRIKQNIYRPYVNRHWHLRERLDAISRHYRIIATEMPFLDIQNRYTHEITRFTLNDAEPLRITVDRPRWLRHEGEIAVSLFHGIDRIYTAVFLISGGPGNRQIIVGNLQGDGRDRLDLYRELTKQFHGIRPRDLVIYILRLLGEALGCTEILGISDNAHRNHHPLSRGTRVATYDESWIDQGGVLDRSTGFFHLTSEIPMRASHEIPTRKRALYRRRYEFLEDLRARIRVAIRAAPPGATDKNFDHKLN